MRVFERSAHRTHAIRMALLEVAEAALAAVQPAHAVAAALARLRAEETASSGPPVDAFVVLGMGKAAVAMGRAAVDALGRSKVRGALVSPAPAPVTGLEVLPGSHPIPDGDSLVAGRSLLDLARSVGPTERALVLVSGGGSAVAEVPVDPLTLEDLRATNSLLLRSGATINELNAVRKHLSALKGGRLGQALGHAHSVWTLILSDVVGSPLDVIASGPTVADPTTFDEALAVLDRYDVLKQAPERVVDHLRKGAAGLVEETPNADADRQTVVVVGSGETAARAACDEVHRRLGPARIITTELEGEARDVAGEVVRCADALELGETLVFAGETTVTVVGDGQGGRNQEVALSASILMQGRNDLVLLAVGTDGVDGMSPSAGAFADGTTVARGRAQGLDASAFLRRNDSHTFLSAVQDTVDSGPTGTNVGDLILIHRRAATPGAP